ncbi:hypothetical protein ACKLNR_003884 [Fusarium oxysporum f. sp. zingiberi]
MPVITSSNNTHLPMNIFVSLSDKATQVLKIPRNGNRSSMTRFSLNLSKGYESQNSGYPHQLFDEQKAKIVHFH